MFRIMLRIAYNILWVLGVVGLTVAVYLALEPAMSACKHPTLLKNLAWVGLVMLAVDVAAAVDKMRER